MTREIGTDAVISKVRLQHQTSHPSAPASGFGYLYLTTGAANGGLGVEDPVGTKYTFITGSVSGRVLIQEQTPTTGTVSFTSIPGTYKKLTLEIIARRTKGAVAYEDIKISLNNDSTATNYRWVGARQNQFGNTLEAGNTNILSTQCPAATTTADYFMVGKAEIIQYANANFMKQILVNVSCPSDSQPYQQNQNSIVQWNSKVAITRLDVYLAAGNFVANTVFRLYGEE